MAEKNNFPTGIDTVIFDFDGTLGYLNIDFPLIRRKILALAAEYNAELNGCEGRYILEMIVFLKNGLTSRGNSPADEFYGRAMEIVSAEELAAARQGSLIPNTRQMLELLKKQGVKLGVVTRNCYAAVSLVLPAIDDYFGAAVITRERTVSFKPHPEHLRTALRTLGSNPEGTLMVGDHPMDIIIGKSLGCATVGVLTGYSTREQLQEAGADLVLASAAEITELPALDRANDGDFAKTPFSSPLVGGD